jgi:hypothetical protein
LTTSISNSTFHTSNSTSWKEFSPCITLALLASMMALQIFNFVLEVLIYFLRTFNLWANPSLGGTTRNHIKEWLRNQKQPNHFFEPFLLNVFTIISYYYSCLSIACFNIWLEVYLGI